MPIVEATAADSHVVLSVERATFAREDEAALVADLFRDPSAQPSLSLLAFLQDKPVGHVLFTKAVLAGASRKVPAAILAPLAVLPEFQRQGVGRALIEHGASLLAASGVQLLFVLGHPGYYTRCGFVPAFPFGLRAPYPIVPEEAWMVRPTGSGRSGHGHGRHRLPREHGQARVLARVGIFSPGGCRDAGPLRFLRGGRRCGRTGTPWRGPAW